MTITVLPKPWSKAGAVRDYTHAPGATTHVVMYETELAALSTTASSVGASAVVSLTSRAIRPTYSDSDRHPTIQSPLRPPVGIRSAN